jgi:hypothetical protein
MKMLRSTRCPQLEDGLAPPASAPVPKSQLDPDLDTLAEAMSAMLPNRDRGDESQRSVEMYHEEMRKIRPSATSRVKRRQAAFDGRDGAGLR